VYVHIVACGALVLFFSPLDQVLHNNGLVDQARGLSLQNFKKYSFEVALGTCSHIKSYHPHHRHFYQ